MDFLYALRLVRDDSAHITRLSWNNVSIYGLMRNGTLMLHKDDEQFYQWIVNDGDMAAKDWCVL